MTQLDLICVEPYLVGMFGAVSFLSFSIGSILITRVIDLYGRRPTILAASLVTPIGIVLTVLIGTNLWIIYAIIFLIGLSYNCRGSTAFLYGSELLHTKYHLKFSQFLFAFVGCFNVITAIFFYLTRS